MGRRAIKEIKALLLAVTITLVGAVALLAWSRLLVEIIPQPLTASEFTKQLWETFQ